MAYLTTGAKEFQESGEDTPHPQAEQPACETGMWVSKEWV